LLQTRNVKGPSEGLLEIETAKELTVSHMFERSNKARVLHVAGVLLQRGIGKVSIDAARDWAKNTYAVCP
jgi:hypothetical protein